MKSPSNITHVSTAFDSTEDEQPVDQPSPNPPPFNYKAYKAYFNKNEWTIIENNMNKKITISDNPEENEMIKFIRAQNRVIRIELGTDIVKRVLGKRLDARNKIACCFFYFDKFGMRKSYRILWVRMLFFDMSVSIYGVSGNRDGVEDDMKDCLKIMYTNV